MNGIRDLPKCTAIAAAAFLATMHPTAKAGDVMAIDDGAGQILDVRAKIAGTARTVDVVAQGEGLIREVKAGPKRAPVKIIRDGDDLIVVAIARGKVHPVVAVDANGSEHAVVGLERDDESHIIDIKAVDGDAVLGVKAIGALDNTCRIKGVDLGAGDVEGTVEGIAFHAHVKAICG